MRIYIYTFGKSTISVKSGIPIEVGAVLRDSFKYPLHDDTGDNISKENPYYGELTGMYWVWKNVQIENDEIIGFSHYNKALDISEKLCKEWLAFHSDGMITVNPKMIRDHPVSDEVAGVLAILKRYEPEYMAWKRIYDETAAAKGNYCRGANMFITTGATFKSYCEWLFPILKEMRQIVGDKPDVEPYWKRYCAFMGERLLAVYIESRNLPTLDVPVRMKRWWIPFLGKIRRNLHISTHNWLYHKLQTYVGLKSQYGLRE